MFPGGTHPHEGVNGKAVNSGNAIRELPAPARVVIPLSQHIGAPCKPIVQKGDLVLAGQKIGEAGGFVSAPVHSSVSGKVVGIEPVELANGSTVSAVVIENDFQNNWVELHPAEHPETLTAQELQTIVREAGIVGMGGATFPTQVKITPPKGKTIEKLVINGAECEPYLTADHRLMLEKPAEIIDGIHLMMLALDVKEAHVGVENNKMDAVEALRAAAKNVEGITIHDLPVRYPQGGEKQLVYALTRRKVPTGGLPLDVSKVRRIWPCQGGEGHFMARLVKAGTPRALPAPGEYTPEEQLWLAAAAEAGKKAKGGKPQKAAKPADARSARRENSRACREAVQGRSSRSREAGAGDASPAQSLAAWREFAEEYFPELAKRPAVVHGGGVLLPAAFPQTNLHVLRAGVFVGSVQKGRFVPEHHLFTAFGALCRNCEELTLADSRTVEYLSGREIEAHTAADGWCCVTVDGWPLGGGKVSGGRVKNHYPKALRLL